MNKIRITLIAVAAVLLISAIAAITINANRNARLTIIVTPVDSTIQINGKQFNNGTTDRFPGEVEILRARVLEPLRKRVVVVGADIAHAVFRLIVGKVDVVRIEGKLQDLHSGESGKIAQLDHRVGHHAQVLRNDVQIRECGFNSRDKGLARSGDPVSAARRSLAEGHGPVALQAAEMVDADHVEQPGRRMEPPDPPGVAVLRHPVPVVERVAPKLPVLGEIVRRDSRHLGRPALAVQLKHAPVRPYVRAVQRNIDRHVADDADPLFMDVRSQLVPLTVEEILDVDAAVDLFAQLFGIPLQDLGVGTQARGLVLPLRPGLQSEAGLERREQRVGLSPGRAQTPFSAARRDGRTALRNPRVPDRCPNRTRGSPLFQGARPRREGQDR